MAKFNWTVQQGSLDWYRLRSGIPTASEFHHIITPARGELSASRKGYACRLLAERLMNWQADSLEKIEHIAHGREMEPFAVRSLELIRDIETKAVGFVTTDDGRFGASPDRVADVKVSRVTVIDQGIAQGVEVSGVAVGTVIEVKAPTIPIQMERLLYGHDASYRCQVQGQIWVAEADKAIFHSYHPRMPHYTIETGRDEPFLLKLKNCLEQFSDELEALMEKAKTLGAFQAFEQVVTPLDAELGDLAEELGILGDPNRMEA